MPLFNASIIAKCIQQSAATGVDQHDAVLHSGDRGATNHMFVFRRERAMQRNDVRLREQFVQLDVPHAERPTGRIWKWIERQSRATESGENLRHHGPNLSRADHADRFSVHVEPDQAVEREITFAHSIIGAMQFPVERQHESDGVLGHRVRRVRRNAHHRDAVFRRGGEIDIVITGAPQRDQPHA